MRRVQDSCWIFLDFPWFFLISAEAWGARRYVHAGVERLTRKRAACCRRLWVNQAFYFCHR